MAALSVNNLGRVGITDLDSELAAASAGGDTFAYNPRTCLIVKNGSGGNVTVTGSAYNDEVEVSGFGTLAVDDFTMVVAAGDYAITPFFEQAFRNASGAVAFTYSSHSSVSVGAFNFAELTTR